MLKAIAFTVIFWTVWLFGLRPIFYGGGDETAKRSEAADDNLRRKSMEQSQRTEQLQDRYELQFKQSEETLKRQDDLLNRWEKIIERWEKTAPGTRQ